MFGVNGQKIGSLGLKINPSFFPLYQDKFS